MEGQGTLSNNMQHKLLENFIEVHLVSNAKDSAILKIIILNNVRRRRWIRLLIKKVQ